jgi:hypothetical protein
MTGGKTLSLCAPDQINNSIQSGFFDDTILCGTCDGKLGQYDKHAIEVSRLIGTTRESIGALQFSVRHNGEIDHQSLALFAGAVVWRASVSLRIKSLSGFTLGTNEPWLRQMIFREVGAIPDVVVARLVGNTAIHHKAAMAALSYPVAIKSKRGTWMARFVLHGLMFLVCTSRSPERWMREESVTAFGRSAGMDQLIGKIMPFDQLADLAQVKRSKYVQRILSPDGGCLT